MKKIILLVSLMSLVYANSYGNQDYSKGYIIKNNQDTVFGYLLNQNSFQACKKCIFKETLEGRKQTYYPSELFGYRYKDGRFYMAKTILNASQEHEKKVFLEILMEGIASVYYLRDKNGDRYFIDKAPYGIMELSRPQQKYNFYYQEILKLLMDDWEDSKNKINDTKLNYLSLVDLAKQYHQKVCTTDDSCIVYKRAFKEVDYNYILVYGSTITDYKFGDKLITNNGIGHQIGVSLKLDNVVFSNNALGVNIALLLEFENKLTLRPRNSTNVYVSYEGVEYRLNPDNDAFQAVSELPIEMRLLDLKFPVLMDYKIDYEPVTLRVGDRRYKQVCFEL